MVSRNHEWSFLDKDGQKQSIAINGLGHKPRSSSRSQAGEPEVVDDQMTPQSVYLLFFKKDPTADKCNTSPCEYRRKRNEIVLEANFLSENMIGNLPNSH